MAKSAWAAAGSAVTRGSTTFRHTEVFERMAKASNGRLVSKPVNSNYWDHPAGGCRMGTSPATSVCDSYGRTHDHENLFVIGAPLHLYKQLKYAYGLTRFSALWRFFALLFLHGQFARPAFRVAVVAVALTVLLYAVGVTDPHLAIGTSAAAVAAIAWILFRLFAPHYVRQERNMLI